MPIKATAQTILYVLKLFEVRNTRHLSHYLYCADDVVQEYKDALPKIASLLDSVQQMWDTLEEVTKRVRLEDTRLKSRFEQFLECEPVCSRRRDRLLTPDRILWRIVIRLRMVLHSSGVKRAMAIESVKTRLDDERQQIQRAREDIMVSRSATGGRIP